MRGHICKIFYGTLFVLFSIYPLFIRAQAGLVNINIATSAELQTLTGIGPSKAQAIIDYRNGPFGPFEIIDEIKNVSGIGDATYNNIKDFITIGESPAPEDYDEEISSYTSGPSPASSHYSSNSLSDKPEETNVQIGVGRDRLVAAGSPIEFQVESNLNHSRRNNFRWNFGDGSEGYGEITTHTYEYPGEYVVVLTASAQGSEVVTRGSVQVFDPKLVVTLATHERVEIKNDSQYEANLFGRVLWLGDNFFIFPKDTIIKPYQSISFSSRITGLYPNNTYEVQFLVIGDMEQPKIATKIKEEKLSREQYIQNQIRSLQQKIAIIYSTQPKTLVADPPREEVLEVIQQSGTVEEGEPSESQTAVAKEGWLMLFKQFFFRRK